MSTQLASVSSRPVGGAGRSPWNWSLLNWAAPSLVIYEIVMIASVWGRWTTVGMLLALHATRIVGNVGTLVWVARSKATRREVGLWGGMCINMLVTAVESQVLHWSLVAWIHMLFQVAFLNGLQKRDNLLMHRLGAGLFLSVSAMLGLREGIEPARVGLFCLVAILLYGMGEASQKMVLAALDASRRSQQQLLRMQEQLVAHEKLSSLGLLAAGVAHEINNPMAYVTSNIRSLSRDMAALPQLPQELREYVDEVLPATLDGIRRVNSIVADLRKFARSDSEKPVEFDLHGEIHSAIRLSNCELKPNCRVEVELGEVPILVGRPRQIGQVLVNLVVNAVQALPAEGGVVKVSTRSEADEVLVQVSDTGVGMSKEVLGQLFQPFFTTKPVGEGTGLGLAVAYGIVTGHGGHIELESELGKGTRVTLRLPASAAKVQAALATVQQTLNAAQARH